MRAFGLLHLSLLVQSLSLPGLQAGFQSVEKAGQKVTPHGIRRTAAQWAARCNANNKQLLATGRWKTVQAVIVYVNQGQAESFAADGDDPIYRIWPWKYAVIGASKDEWDGRDKC